MSKKDDMKVVILCGGMGYRLKEETEFKPKPMVQIGGKPILWHIMKIYSHFGFNEFIIALGYKGEFIKDYFINQKYFANNFSINTKTGSARICRDGSKISEDFKITFVDTGEETLVGERILRVKDYIGDNDDFMVTYGDGVSDINLKDLVSFHKVHKRIGTVTGVHPRSKYGLLSVGRQNNAEKLVEKPVLKEWTNGGFMVYKREFFKYLKKGEMEHPAMKRLIKENQLSVYRHDGFFHAMDTYQDMNNLNKMWEDSPPWKVWK